MDEPRTHHGSFGVGRADSGAPARASSASRAPHVPSKTSRTGAEDAADTLGRPRLGTVVRPDTVAKSVGCGGELIPPPVLTPAELGLPVYADNGPPDDELLHHAQAGDAGAFKMLVERHQRAIYGYLRARVLEPADAEDMCQEVFLRGYQMPATFVSPIMVRPWLLGIARNVLREHIRRLSRRKEVAWTTLCLDVDESTPEVDDRYEDVVGLLPGCIESLGASARDALDMYYRSKLRLAQIGERLRRSEGAVKLLMFRARQALKNCLSRKAGCKLGE